MKKAEHVKKWRQLTKKRMIDAMGGCCQICGYNKSFIALEFHHIIPSQKEFGLSSMRVSIKSWDKIILELKKCILLCSNCHKEIHNGDIVLPENYKVFDEKFCSYKTLKEYGVCRNCGERLNRNTKNNLCDKCVRFFKRKVVRPEKDVLLNDIKQLGYRGTGRKYGVSDNAIRKWLK